MRRSRLLLVVVAALLAGCSGTVRQSVSNDELEANRHSWEASISGAGKMIAFSSDADNLVAGDTNDVQDVFLRDTTAGTTTRISTARGGGQADGISRQPSISTDGRYVAFASDATNLVTDDGNAATDVFVHDRLGRTTRRVSISATGGDANGHSQNPELAPDGQSVLFTSWATNLVAGAPPNGAFVADLTGTGGITSESSVALCPEPPVNSHVTSAAISGDGSRVVYHLYCQSSYSRWVLIVRDTTTNQEVAIHSRSYEYSGPRPVAISANGSVISLTSYEAFYTRGQVFETLRLLVATENGNWSVSESESDAYGEVSLSDDGQLLAVATRCAEGYCVKVLDRGTSQWHTASVKPDGSPAAASDPDLSPDGTHLSFLSDKAVVVGDRNGAIDVFTRPLSIVLGR